MSVTRGEFLKQLGKSLPGMVLGSGVAVAAGRVLGKMAAASGVGEAFAGETGQGKKSDPPESFSTHNPDFIHSGPVSTNRIALTFDDGPTPGVTELVLEELKRQGVHATFFMIGKRIAAAPDLARRVLAEGHEIGNHTFTHPDLTKLPPAQVDAEIQKTQDILRDVLAYTPKWFRPPYGALRANQAGAILHRGMRIAMWSVDTRDWSRPGTDKIIAAALAEPKPGGIILCHDRHQQTSEAVAPILNGIREAGYVASKVSSLFE